ncbi:MAG: HlyD family efflux transporter periplasmic adaptor subunit [Phycisphaerae bacterium]|nr:HlyD family efflux transporter periplasmic adaptor subunit [Phycisphaerae bacterium]
MLDLGSVTKRPSRRGMAWLRVGFVLVVAILAIAGTVVLWRASAGAPPADRGDSADIAPARLASFDITTTATGELEARNQIELRSRLERTSTILEIVPEGTRVKAGDVLVRLNADDIQTQIEEDVSRVEAARADLVNAENAFAIQVSENESKLRKAGLNIELATLALDQWLKGEVEQKRKDLELQLENTKKELERLENKHANSLNLFRREFLSKNELDLDEISLRKARADREKALLANETYWEYQYPKDEKTRRSDVAEAQAELQRVEKTNESQLAQRQAQLNNAQTQLASRENRLARLRAQFDAAVLRAPTDGLIVYSTSTDRGRGPMMSQGGTLQVGTQVQPNQAMIILPDTTEMRAAVRVHESLAGRIKPGQPAAVRVEAANTVFQGVVESIGVLAETGGWRDPNLREYTVRISLAGDVQALKPSMQCEAQILLGRVESALVVPVQAVFMDGAVRFVYKPRGSRFVRVPVRLGRRSDLFAQVLKGLGEGERVLVRQPQPGEVIAGEWDRAALTLAGYQVNDEGRPTDPEAEAGLRVTAPPGMPVEGAPGDPRNGPPGTRPREGSGTNGQDARPGRSDGMSERGGNPEHRRRPAQDEPASTDNDARTRGEPAPGKST